MCRFSSSQALIVLLIFLLSGCAPAIDAEGSAVTSQQQAPGAQPYPESLRMKLEEALRDLGSDYEPRTEHLREDGSPVYINRLLLEESPYLRQHAHNPVDWYPWGEEAFDRAKEEDKPIFLSIGYSTCHWCHVMEEESFDNEEIARLMNEMFICIKMDRERRPDVDDFYMTAVQLQTGRGGWPMSSFLTPDGKPFFGGTYFPPNQFAHLLQNVNAGWLDRRPEIDTQAERLTQAVREVITAAGAAQEIDDSMIQRAVDQLLERHDAVHGGFSPKPKFPNETHLLFLLDQALRRHQDGVLRALTNTLDAMARGGIYDQVGGGFHRYSVDEIWLVPHFEKMLYNQAHLSRAYAQAYRLTGQTFYARIARQTLDYVLREMTSPEGGFYSATDADSEGEEGRFFVWTPTELKQILKPEETELILELYGMSEGGNFEGHNIPYLAQDFESFAKSKQLSVEDLLARIDPIRESLWQERQKREKPLLDDKLITAWNGMMITAFAEAAEILDEPRYRVAAIRSANLLWKVSLQENGTLWRVHLDGRSSIQAVLGDYAHFAQGLIALYDLTGEALWLDRSKKLARTMLENFWDDKNGAFFVSAEGVDPYLLARPKSPFDGALPSDNAVAVRVLVQLEKRTGELRFRSKTGAAIAALSNAIERSPAGTSYLLLAIEEHWNGSAGPREDAAQGNVVARSKVEKVGPRTFEVEIDLDFADGWHVNAHQPLQENLIPTVLKIGEDSQDARLIEVYYPEAVLETFAFQDEPLAVWSESTQIRATLELSKPSEGVQILPLQLDLQACNDEACLRPETVRLEIPLASVGRSIVQ